MLAINHQIVNLKIICTLYMLFVATYEGYVNYLLKLANCRTAARGVAGCKTIEKDMTAEEKDEIIENLDIYFAERQSRKRETLNNVLSM